VCTAQAEIDQQLAGRRQHHARSLGRNQRLEMHNIDQPGLNQLCLRHRRGDAHDRLVGEEHAAFRHGVDVAGEAKRRKLVEQCFVKPARAGEPVDFFGEEAKLLEKVEHLFEASGNQEPSARG